MFSFIALPWSLTRNKNSFMNKVKEMGNVADKYTLKIQGADDECSKF